MYFEIVIIKIERKFIIDMPFKIKCLAFAGDRDDLAIITGTPEEAIHTIEKLHDIIIKTVSKFIMR